MSTPGLPCSSWGVSLLALLGGLAVMYLAGGIAWGARQQGKAVQDVGLSLHPHAQVWSEVLGLAADGVAFAQTGGGGGWQPPASVAELLNEGGRGNRRRGGSDSSTRSRKETKKKGTDKGKKDKVKEATVAVAPERTAAAAGTAAGGGGRWVHMTAVLCIMAAVDAQQHHKVSDFTEGAQQQQEQRRWQAVDGSPPPALPRSLLSHTLSDGMVLQRAPQAARIYGYAPAGTTVTTTFGGRVLGPSTADSSHTWRQDLPPTAAGGPHDITVSASMGQNASLRGVLFGDSYVCGGQSNMAFSLPANERFTDEQLEAAKRPNIRLFTVGTAIGTLQDGAAGPQPDLRWVSQRWTPASAASIGGCNPTLDARCMTRVDKNRLLNCSGAVNRLQTCSEFGYFSALCWHFGKKIYDANEGKVPVGLISTNWGGTPLEDWATADAFRACGGFKPEPRDTCRTAVPGMPSSAARLSLPCCYVGACVFDEWPHAGRGGNGPLWNSMLAPFAHGPTQLSGFLWWQGEANTKGLHCARSYQVLHSSAWSHCCRR